VQKLIIVVHQIGQEIPEARITIPIRVVKIAHKLIPNKVREELSAEGINIDDVVSALDELQDVGTIMEVETPDKHIIIAIE